MLILRLSKYLSPKPHFSVPKSPCIATHICHIGWIFGYNTRICAIPDSCNEARPLESSMKQSYAISIVFRYCLKSWIIEVLPKCF
jgi:hypothetical protein